MFDACSKASSGVFASLTPPALPRPPALTCALTTQKPSFSAAARASSGVVTTMPRVVVTPCLANSSFAWYSIRSTSRTLAPARGGARDGPGLAGGVRGVRQEHAHAPAARADLEVLVTSP